MLAEIVMKHSVIILVLFFCTLAAFGQQRRLPPKGTKYPISKFWFDYPIQAGKLEIVRIDSLGQIILRTESSELKFDNQSVFDTLAIALFQSGILTPDILLKTINADAKYIDHKGDTVDYTKHIDTKTVKLMSIQQEAIPKYIKKRKGVILFKVAVTFKEHLPNSGLPSIYDFTLYLQADTDPKLLHFAEYLKKVKTKYIQFTGIEI